MVEGTQDEPAQEEVSPAQRHIIERPRLYKLLDEANAKIILLVAPAGYGKTTLARQWTSRRGRRAFWYRAGASSLDAAALTQGLADTIATEFPEAPRRVHEYLLAARSPNDAPEVLAEVLAENVAAWPAEAWLVIDDYHAFAGADPAEVVLEHLSEIAQLNILITSRQPPRWISPRRVLYGEVFEVGRDELAMNEEEALTVMSFQGVEPGRIFELAKGWPAVIGLAALIPAAREPVGEISLHDFLADELFSTLTKSVRKKLPLLALSSVLDRQTVEVILGSDGMRVVRDAIRVGLGSALQGVVIELHPLVRQFLLRKLDERPPTPEVLKRLTDHLVASARWDEAFALIDRYELVDGLRLLLSEAVRRSLINSRSAAIEKWVKWADSRAIEAPEITLARAELLLNGGDWTAADLAASACAETIDDPELAASAYLCAGRAAHLADNAEIAQQHFQRARELDSSPEVMRQALWGEFLCAVFGRRANRSPREVRLAFEQARDSSPIHLVRLRQAALIEAAIDGNLAIAADAGLEVEALLEDVRDPYVRSGFLNNLADALAMSARYHDGERISHYELDVARRNRLAFVQPNGQLNLASCRLGLGDYLECSSLIDEVRRLERGVDSFVRANTVSISARLAISRGKLEELPHEDMIPADAREDIQGEAIATIAFGEALRGNLERATALITRVESARGFILGPARAAVAATQAVVARSMSQAAHEQSIGAFAAVVEATGAYDCVIWTTRGDSAFLHDLVESATALAVVKKASARSQDATLRSALGRGPSPIEASRPLTAREREILALVGQGFRNADIATRLFISPKTVKTHLQNIFEKLGTRTRTEAVVKAKNLRLLD
jgi:LuxR family transcriptional regulator, maltose regulon positive regulatory protein